MFPDNHVQKVGGGCNIGTVDRIASGNGAIGASSVRIEGPTSAGEGNALDAFISLISFF